MSLTKTYTVFCDAMASSPQAAALGGCLYWGAQALSAKEARAGATRAGWKRLPLKFDGSLVDVCPGCLPAVKS